MFNIRYHIASLVGVFLALAMGLILGGLVVQQGAVERQQGALVDGLRNEFSDIRSDNQRLTAENDAYAGFSDEMVAAWATARLEGRTIVVVDTGEQSDAVRSVTRAIESAGGTTALLTVRQPALGLDSDEVRSALASAAAPADLESVAASLAAEWATPGEPRELTGLLSDLGALEIEGLGDEAMASGLVDVATREESPDDAGLALAVAFSGLGPAVGAQLNDDAAGLAAAAHEAGLSALEAVETALGRYSLLALLNGGEPGRYGPTADADSPFVRLPPE